MREEDELRRRLGGVKHVSDFVIVLVDARALQRFRRESAEQQVPSDPAVPTHAATVPGSNYPVGMLPNVQAANVDRRFRRLA